MRQLEPASRGHKRSTGILALAVTIAALSPAVYWMARPFLAAGVLAAILAVALDPLHSRTGRLVRSPTVAALITTSVAVGPVVAAIVLGGMAVNREIRSGVLADFVRTIAGLTGRTSVDFHAIQEALPQLNRIAGGLFTGVFAAVFLYVLLAHGKTWVTQLTALLPIDASVSDRILAALRDAIVANVDGILAMGTVEAILFGTIFWVAGIASPALWGAFAGLSSMIPLVGAAAVWLPLAIALAVHGTWIKAAVIGVVCFATQQAVALLLMPRIMAKRLPQSPLLIALSILGATSAFGALGMLVGPVIVSVFGALAQEFRIQLRLNAVPQVGTRE